jgi:hypothetical protein
MSKLALVQINASTAFNVSFRARKVHTVVAGVTVNSAKIARPSGHERFQTLGDLVITPAPKKGFVALARDAGRNVAVEVARGETEDIVFEKAVKATWAKHVTA